MAGFGPNEWLVYEMYQQYLKDPESVDKAWWDFFADYQPTESQAGPSPTSTTATPSTNGSATTVKPSASSGDARGATASSTESKNAEKEAGRPAPSEKSASEPAKPTTSAADPQGRASGVRSNGASE